jgi:hypothetical protein
MMSSMRGGFRSAVGKVTGAGGAKQAPPGRRLVWNVVTAALVAGAALLLLRRFGVISF